jgi:hypothetical protein
VPLYVILFNVYTFDSPYGPQPTLASCRHKAVLPGFASYCEISL